MTVSTDLRPEIKKLVAKTDLSPAEITEAFDAILAALVPDTAVAAFLVALAMKGETPDELRSILVSLRNHATKITPQVSGSLIDTCGTGGDSIKSFNISTASAIVASAASAKVAKHGNRSASSVCGSADFLEYIGLDLNAPPAKVQSCIENIGIGFLFAPLFHPSMKNVASVRKTIGVRTVFNKIGPLSNPCTNISGQLIGVFEPQLLQVFSEVCAGYISEAMIVYAHDGFDELSNTCQNDIYWISNDSETTRRILLHPNAVGMEVAKAEQLVVNSKIDSVMSTLQAIYGKGSREKRDIVVLNAAAALVVSKISSNLKEGVEYARDAIKSGKARDKLSQMIRYCGDLEKLKEAEKKFSLL
ncbi:MAG: anthranilate phosphoribosyltransferase [Thermoproteota archaeon]|nr:anthranilate phosphoribosyltransferase [Thermoproteota archaeon]